MQRGPPPNTGKALCAKPMLTDEDPTRRDEPPKFPRDRWRTLVYALQAVAAAATALVAISQLL